MPKRCLAPAPVVLPSTRRKNLIGWCWMIGLFLAFGAWVGLIAALPLTIGVCSR